MFGSDIMVAPVLNPVGSDSSSRATSNARNGGQNSATPVASVKVYIPANSNWVHLWTGQEVRGNQGRYVAVDAPIGYPPVFYLSSSIYGLKLREFVVKNGYDAGVVMSVTSVSNSDAIAIAVAVADPVIVTTATANTAASTTKTTSIRTAATPSSRSSQYKTSISNSGQSDNFTTPHLTVISEDISNSKGHHRNLKGNKYSYNAVIGEIADYIEPDWTEWLGISQYVSKWDSTYYTIPLATSSGNAIGIKGLGSSPNTDGGNVIINGNSNMMFQDIDVDLASLFQ